MWPTQAVLYFKYCLFSSHSIAQLRESKTTVNFVLHWTKIARTSVDLITWEYKTETIKWLCSNRGWRWKYAVLCVNQLLANPFSAVINLNWISPHSRHKGWIILCTHINALLCCHILFFTSLLVLWVTVYRVKPWKSHIFRWIDRNSGLFPPNTTCLYCSQSPGKAVVGEISLSVPSVMDFSLFDYWTSVQNCEIRNKPLALWFWVTHTKKPDVCIDVFSIPTQTVRHGKNIPDNKSG